MKKFLYFLVMFCFCAIMMSACRRNDTPAEPLSRVVTRVDISCYKEHMLIQRHYTDTQKMEYVLLYLRLLKSKGKPDVDPDEVQKDVYEITVHLSDGNQKIYRQKAHKYFSRESRPWELIDPEQAAGLYAIMEHLPSDTVMAYI